MSDINVKDIRKRAELLGMKPENLLKEYDITQRQTIIKTDIKSDFEEKVEILFNNHNFTKFTTEINKLTKQIKSTKKNQIDLVKQMLVFLTIFLFVLLVIIINNVTFLGIFFISVIALVIFIFASILCKILYDYITVEKKSPERYVIEEFVKIIELIEKQEKY